MVKYLILLSSFVLLFCKAVFGQSVTVQSDKQNICQGEQVTFTATVSSISSPNFVWTVNNVDQNNNSTTFTSSNISSSDVVKVVVSESGGSCLDGNNHKVIISGNYIFTIHKDGGIASVQMSQSRYDSWINNDDFNDATKRQNLMKEVYKVFKDDFEFTFLILNETVRPASLSYTGQLQFVSSTTTGIGITPFDNSPDYGSQGKLKSVMALTRDNYIRYGPSLHELMHTWGNFSVNTEAFDPWGPGSGNYGFKPHWGISGCGGQLGGFDQSSLQTNIDGNPKKYSGTFDGDPEWGQFANGGNGLAYSNYELYLMGMIPASQITPFDVFTDITSYDYYTGTWTADTRTTYDKTNLEQANGVRVPDFSASQKKFKLLALVLTPTALTEAQWNTQSAGAEWFSMEGDEGTSSYNFWEATNGVGSIDLDLSNSIINCGSGGVSATDDISITVNTSVTPTVSISESANNSCAGTQVTFTAVATNDGTGSYKWYVGTQLQSETTSSFTYTSSDNDVVKTELTSSLSCVTSNTANSNSITMQTVTSTIPSVSIVSSASTICSGESVAFTATPTNGGSTPSYEWFINTVSQGNDNVSFSSSSLSNGDKVKVVITASGTCSSGTANSNEEMVMVAESVSVTTTVSNQVLSEGFTSYQLNLGDYFQGTTSDDNLIYSISSANVVTTSITGKMLSISYLSTGNETATITAEDACGNKETVDVLFAITSISTISVDLVSVITNDNIDAQTDIDFVSTVSGVSITEIASYNIIVRNLSTGTITPITGSVDELSATWFSSVGNYSVYSILNLNNGSQFYSSTITFRVQETVNGLFTTSENEVELYPNPVQDQLTIDLNQLELVELFIVNSIGQTVYQIDEMETELFQINTNNWAEGVYFVKMTLHSGAVKVVRFKKE
jgi:hypothetical protein